MSNVEPSGLAVGVGVERRLHGSHLDPELVRQRLSASTGHGPQVHRLGLKDFVQPVRGFQVDPVHSMEDSAIRRFP